MKKWTLTVDPVGIVWGAVSTGVIVFLTYSFLEWWRIALICILSWIQIEGKQ